MKCFYYQIDNYKQVLEETFLSKMQCLTAEAIGYDQLKKIKLDILKEIKSKILDVVDESIRDQVKFDDQMDDIELKLNRIMVKSI